MIKVGDVIKLRPSVFEKEYQECEWANKYLYEDQFEFISLRFKNMDQRGDVAKTFFGSSETIVEKIENDDDGQPWIVNGQPFIVLTDKFTIIYPEALKKNEISVSPAEEADFNIVKSEKQLINDLEFFEQGYLEGIFNVMERENNKLDTYKRGFYMMKSEGKWKV